MQNDQVTILKDYSDSYTKNGLGGLSINRENGQETHNNLSKR